MNVSQLFCRGSRPYVFVLFLVCFLGGLYFFNRNSTSKLVSMGHLAIKDFLADRTSLQERKKPSDVDWQSVHRRKKLPKNELHDKWIVLTTINRPTEDVKKLARIDGWKVVVVGDTKTPSDWRLVFFLSSIAVIFHFTSSTQNG